MQIALTTASYEARGIIADAQRCINLYIEQNPPDSPFPFTHYPTPGLLKLSIAPLVQEVRGLYTASNGHLYGVIGNVLYDISKSWAFTQVGVITSASGIVSMKDNNIVMVLVDGSANGWAIDLATNNFEQIVADAFYGANKVDYLDTFFVFNRQNTNQFYSSRSNVNFADMVGGPIVSGAISNAGSAYTDGTYSSVPLITTGNGLDGTADIVVAGGIITTVTIINFGSDYATGDVLTVSNSNIGGTGSGFTWTVATIGSSSFDPLSIAGKTGNSDNLATLAVMHREISLIGFTTTEVWFDAGAADFPFQAMPGAFIEHGCEAVNSVSKYDLALFWLGQDGQGNSVVFQESAYKLQIVSSPAVSNTINGYQSKSDAIGFCYQQSGHAFYVLTFPTEDKTWVYDIGEKHWHERAWMDQDGDLHRWRPNCIAVFNNTIVAGDFENGSLYSVNLDIYEDDGVPIQRIRSFPHQIKEANRVIYRSFVAQMEVGDEMMNGTTDSPIVSLRCSDDAGRSYGNAIQQSLGDIGQYITSVQFNRLGYARDRVFELSWSSPMKTSLNGAYIETMDSAA